MTTIKVDLGETVTLSKLEIAEQQLERAIQLFLDNKDYVSSVTLAGASEEILGKLLEKEGSTHALKDFTKACVDIGKQIYGEEWHEKTFVSIANYFRDGFKHYTDGQPITLNRECASEIIERAICNYFALTGNESNSMQRFKKVMFGI